jgi:hypothetical protein
MAAQSIDRPRPKRASRPLKPRKGSKTAAILALATTTPATPPEIAESLNLSSQAIHQCLQRYGITPNTVDSYKKNRAEIFAGLQEKILQSVELEDIKSASILQRITAAGILYDKERLETGKTTANIGTLIARIEDVQREIAGDEG